MKKRNVLARVFLFLLAAGWLGSALGQFDHEQWDDLLSLHVTEFAGGSATAVDYSGFLRDEERLQTYLDSLAQVDDEDFHRWTREEQLAFLINAYNAWTVKLILCEYPKIESIRDIGFLPGAAWRRNIVDLFGERISLDDLEHDMIRVWPQYQEPRIHFAVNCAAIGCPPLRDEAYTGAALNKQLEDNTKLFLADSNRNYLEGETLYVSRIFDWYEEDFEKGWQGINSVPQFLVQYADELELNTKNIEDLLSGTIKIRYLQYDWGLNQLP